MAKRTAPQIVTMKMAYRNSSFSVLRLQKNVEEALFTRAEVLSFLTSLTTEHVKVALALDGSPSNQLTMVILGCNAAGVVSGSDGLVSTMPCPPKCGAQDIKSKIIVSV